MPNPRGSEGRGAEFVRLNTADIGGGDWKDVVAGFNHVLSLGFVDRITHAHPQPVGCGLRWPQVDQRWQRLEQRIEQQLFTAQVTA